MFPCPLFLSVRTPTHHEEQVEDYSHSNHAPSSYPLSPAVLLASLLWPFREWPQATVVSCNPRYVPSPVRPQAFWLTEKT